MSNALIVPAVILGNLNAIQAIGRKLGCFNSAEIDQQFNTSWDGR